MATLTIPPHAPGASRLAVLVLALVAAGSFATGVLRQTATLAPVAESAVEQPAPAPVAAPPPTLQVAKAGPVPRTFAHLTPTPATPVSPLDPVVSARASEPVAADAVANAADPAPALASDAPPTP